MPLHLLNPGDRNPVAEAEMWHERNKWLKELSCTRSVEKCSRRNQVHFEPGSVSLTPEDYFKMCLRNAAARRGIQVEKSVCTVATAYITALKHHRFEMNLPASCLACGTAEYGSRTRHTMSYGSQKEADVVFIIEEKQCNKDLVLELSSIATRMESDLSNGGISSTKFAVIGFGGDIDAGTAHTHTARNEILFDRKDIVLATERMQISRLEKSSDAFEAIVTASEIAFRKGASKNFVLLSCTPCNEESRLDYSDIQRLLLTQGITLHVVSDKTIEVKTSGSIRGRGIVAVDAKSVYRGKDFVQRRLVGQPQLRSQVVVPKDVCIALAQDSRGSFFFTTSPPERKRRSGPNQQDMEVASFATSG